MYFKLLLKFLTYTYCLLLVVGTTISVAKEVNTHLSSCSFNEDRFIQFEATITTLIVIVTSIFQGMYLVVPLNWILDLC